MNPALWYSLLLIANRLASRRPDEESRHSCSEGYASRPPEKYRRRYRGDARRQVQLQAQRRPDDVRPSGGAHDRSEQQLCAAKRPPFQHPRWRKPKDTDGKDKLVAALKASFDFCGDALGENGRREAGRDDRRLRRPAGFARKIRRGPGQQLGRPLCRGRDVSATEWADATDGEEVEEAVVNF